MSILTTIETDLTAAWGDLEQVIETDVAAAWSGFKAALTALLPQEWDALSAIIAEAATDIATGDVEAITTAVLNDLEANGLAFAEKLGAAALNAVIALFVAKIPA